MEKKLTLYDAIKTLDAKSFVNMVFSAIKDEKLTEEELVERLNEECSEKLKKELLLKGTCEDIVDLSNVRTTNLIEELKQREGVRAIIAGPYEKLDVKINGPAIILKIID